MSLVLGVQMEKNTPLSSVNFYSEVPEDVYLSARITMGNLEFNFWFSNSDEGEIDGYVRCQFFGSLPGFLDIHGDPYMLLYSRKKGEERIYFIESFLAESDSYQISKKMAKQLMAGGMPLIFSKHSDKNYIVNVTYKKVRDHIGSYYVP